MTSTAAVIARARAGGEYSERKRFSIARGRAIEKMRRFALADPYFYILELIQAAVANEARFIEISMEDGDVTLAYLGGGLRREDLANLFDYLFASKDRANVGHLRELALGINAALLFQPTRVIVESGDGTLSGTTRLEIHGDHDAVDLGTPQQPLRGTFVRIEGMQRAKLPRVLRRVLMGDPRPREADVIDMRCLAAPVPIILNDEALFGFSAQRMPAMLGYQRVLSFDEGDLYGTLALGRPDQEGKFDLLMWGVLVQSKAHRLFPDASISGIVCFDRLRKTADHSGIVDDQRMAEMWARLRPHAQRLLHGEGARTATVLSQLDGTIVPAIEVRPLMQETRRIILAPPGSETSERDRGVAREIGRRLGAPVFLGHETMVPSLRAMSGGELSVIALDPTRAQDVDFYRQPVSSPPPRPWLTPVIELESLSTADVLARVIALHDGRSEDDLEVVAEARRKAGLLGTGDRVEAAVFTPENTLFAEALHVELVTSERLLWSGTLPSSHPGHILRIVLPDARRSVVVHERIEGARDALCVDIARAMALHAGPALRRAFNRAVEGLVDLEVEPGTPAAALALRAAVRSCIPRLAHAGGGEPRLALDQVEARHIDLCALRVFRTLNGTAITLSDLTDLMLTCEGLVYGVVEETACDLEGLDTSKILRLSREEERSLILLLGDSCYVRVDMREVLAQDGAAQVRDVAAGLRAYPDHPLLVESGDPSASEEALVRALIERLMGHAPASPETAAGREAWQECRRHAARVLQRYVCEVLWRGVETPVPEVFDLPLFLDPEGGAHGIAEVIDAMRRPGALPLVYGHALGGSELGALTRAAQRGQGARGEPHTVAASSWLHHCLSRLGPVRVAFDFALAPADAPRFDERTSWLESAVVEAPGVQGVVGISNHPVNHMDIAVVTSDGQRSRALASVAIAYGCVGWIRLDVRSGWNGAQQGELERSVRAACEACLEAVFVRLTREPDLPQRARCESLLLDYAARNLSLIVQADPRPRPAVASELADRILSLPLFQAVQGEAMSGWRLVRLYCRAFALDPRRARTKALEGLAPGVAPHLSSWLEWTLQEARVTVAPGSPPVPAADESPSVQTHEGERLQHAVLHWLRSSGLDFITHVWLHGDALQGLCSIDGSSLFINPLHPRTAAALEQRSAAALAWLLLGAFAHINAKLGEVENHHERSFQLRIAQALRDGRLEWSTAAPRASAGPAASSPW